MTTEEQFKFSQQQARFRPQPTSLLGKLLAFTLGAAFLVLAFMFSLVALAVIAVGGLLVWGWLWWKTRAIRKQLREQGPPAASHDDSQVIEGEVIREAEPATRPKRLLRADL